MSAVLQYTEPVDGECSSCKFRGHSSRTENKFVSMESSIEVRSIAIVSYYTCKANAPFMGGFPEMKVIDSCGQYKKR